MTKRNAQQPKHYRPCSSPIWNAPPAPSRHEVMMNCNGVRHFVRQDRLSGVSWSSPALTNNMPPSREALSESQATSPSRASTTRATANAKAPATNQTKRYALTKIQVGSNAQHAIRENGNVYRRTYRNLTRSVVASSWCGSPRMLTTVGYSVVPSGRRGLLAPSAHREPAMRDCVHPTAVRVRRTRRQGIGIRCRAPLGGRDPGSDARGPCSRRRPSDVRPPAAACYRPSRTRLSTANS